MEEKEQLLKDYFEATRAAIESIELDQIDQLLDIIEIREDLIEQIKALDEDNGSTIKSPQIIELINYIRPLDQHLISKMNEKKDEIQSKMSSIQVGKQLRGQYNQHYENADGIFYDKRQ